MEKIVFSDIDGTIRPRNGKISEYSKEVLKALNARNIPVVFVTGRNREIAEKVASEFDSRFVIDSNGGEIFDIQTRNSLFLTPLPKEGVSELYEFCMSRKLPMLIHVNADFSFASIPGNSDAVERPISSIDEIFANYTVVGGVILNIPDEELSKVKSKVFSLDGMSIGNEGLHPNANSLDFTSKYSSKGIAIKRLLQHLGLSYDDAISFGDGINDISMFTATHKSVALGNANDGLKALADDLAGNCTDDGVAKYLAKHLLA